MGQLRIDVELSEGVRREVTLKEKKPNHRGGGWEGGVVTCWSLHHSEVVN